MTFRLHVYVVAPGMSFARKLRLMIDHFMLVLWHNDAFMHFHPVAGSQTIGRSPASDVLLGDHMVSRCHARVDRTEFDWVLRDLESRNGTFVNQQRIVEAPVKIGDRIEIRPYKLMACLPGEELKVVSSLEDLTPSVKHVDDVQADLDVPLSTYQKVVYDKMMDGLSQKQLALTLGVAIDTIRYHVKIIYKAYNVNSHAELMAIDNKRKPR